MTASAKIPSLAGVKFSHTAVFDMQAALAVDEGRYNLLFGSDEMLLSGLCGGAHGAVGSTYNFAAPLYNRIIAAYTACDMPTAQRLQAHAVEMVNVLVRHGGLPAIKAVMSFLDLDCGPVRLPLVALTPAEQQALHQDSRRHQLLRLGPPRRVASVLPCLAPAAPSPPPSTPAAGARHGLARTCATIRE